ncbi:MAG TPA: exopolysaccharide biosynthesis protein [Solirubrobacteraceae bacterium]|nr:exopolysaccharide biosynthesis protein [Solirubrobacteraceae bacterium]
MATDEQLAPERVSDELERWLKGDQRKTLGGLIDAFGEGSFALIFVLLMAVPALPLPTGGVTHVLEVIVMLLALELIAGRRKVWLPQRWRKLELAGARQQKFIDTLLRRIRALERFSRPRGRWLFGHRLSASAFGLVVLALALTAFLAPPFSGLDTLPSIGVVVLALGYLLTDLVLSAIGIVIGALGVVSVIFLGSIAVKFAGEIF